MKFRSMILLIVLFWVTGLVQTAAAFDHSGFDKILQKYVTDKGLVDYNGIAQNPLFKAYISALETADIEAMSTKERLAFWINAYNAVTIDKVIKWKPQKSVRETIIPGVWTSTKFYNTKEHRVVGKLMSQDDIENEILRRQFKDPRIHFAIICASSGCPPLPRFAYTGNNVQAKLEEEARKYINSPRGIRIDPKNNSVLISSLFDWYAGDFEHKAGSVTDFIKQYLDKEAKIFLEQNPKITYLPYDWSLNAQEAVK